MYHVFIQQGVFLCIDNRPIPTVNDNVFTHLEYVSCWIVGVPVSQSWSWHNFTKQGSLGKNFINPLTLRISSDRENCDIVNIKAVADRKISDEINYR